MGAELDGDIRRGLKSSNPTRRFGSGGMHGGATNATSGCFVDLYIQVHIGISIPYKGPSGTLRGLLGLIGRGRISLPGPMLFWLMRHTKGTGASVLGVVCSL